MSISTKGGDKGKTSLWSGQRVWKSDIRVESYGTIDELDSHIGEAKHYVKLDHVKEILESIQNELMRVMGELASVEKQFTSPISAEDLEKITNCVHDFENKVPLKGFVVPGNTIQSSKLDICRTIARRAERRIIALNQDQAVNPNLIGFVNRLSDLFFIIARAEEQHDGGIKYKDIHIDINC
jgi:ATP:cob(I)alamin adenosyltransferase